MLHVSLRLLSLLAVVALVSADYTIDDANAVLKYTSVAKFWRLFNATSYIQFSNGPNGTLLPVYPTNCYNYTYTYGACYTGSQCQIQIPFTGSGATVYVQQGGPDGVNASFSVDKQPESYSLLQSIPAPTFQKSNVSLFSVQGLVSGTHTINLTVLDWENSFSNFFLDSIVVNETVVTSAPTSSSTAPTSSASSSATSSARTSHSSHAGAIAGGVIGGLAVILLAVSFFLWRRSCLTPNDTGRFDESDKSLRPQSFYTSPSSGLPVSIPTAPNDNMAVPQSNSQQPQIIYHPHSPVSTDAPHTQGSEPNGSSVLLSGGVLGEKGASEAVGGPGGMLRRSPMSASANHGGDSLGILPTGGVPRLTDEQADFINTLHVNHVPASAVARVVERMLAGAPPSAMRGQDWMTDSGVENLAPPVYEEHVER